MLVAADDGRRRHDADRSPARRRSTSSLGNAPDVTVTFRGQPLDLAPYMRGNVARVALK